MRNVKLKILLFTRPPYAYMYPKIEPAPWRTKEEKEDLYFLSERANSHSTERTPRLHVLTAASLGSPNAQHTRALRRFVF